MEATAATLPGYARTAPSFSNESRANAGPARVVPSTDLLQGDKTVEIAHNGAIYRLQATRLGKLILTK